MYFNFGIIYWHFFHHLNFHFAMPSASWRKTRTNEQKEPKGNIAFKLIKCNLKCHKFGHLIWLKCTRAQHPTHQTDPNNHKNNIINVYWIEFLANIVFLMAVLLDFVLFLFCSVNTGSRFANQNASPNHYVKLKCWPVQTNGQHKIKIVAHFIQIMG